MAVSPAEIDEVGISRILRENAQRLNCGVDNKTLWTPKHCTRVLMYGLFDKYFPRALLWLNRYEPALGKSVQCGYDKFCSCIDEINAHISASDLAAAKEKLRDARCLAARLAETLQDAAKYLATKEPGETGHIPSKMLGDTITIKGLTINWRVICDKLKKQLFRLRAFLHKGK